MNSKTFNSNYEALFLNSETHMDEISSFIEEYPWFQAAWMIYLKNLQKTDAQKFEMLLKKAALILPDRKKLYSVLYLNHDAKADLQGNSSESYPIEVENEELNIDQNNLIDRFLTVGHSVVRKAYNSENESNDNQQKDNILNSIAENDEIVTETLANIYFKQKKYDKAIDAFKKLSLKYPEKSIYFAARIKDVELLKNF
jgi:tetratricopeptide (TPR) repeat protein